jgi:TonB family protein
MRLFRAFLFLLAISASALESQTGTPSPPAANNTGSAVADSTELEPVKVVRPAYPKEAAKKKIHGQVVVKVSVTETGDVDTVEIISGDPILAKAAIDAVTQWKFKPFIHDGKPVKASTKIPLDFGSDEKDVSGLENAAGNPNLVQVPEKVAQGMLLKRVQPVYPAIAMQGHIQGTVVLKVIIEKDGHISQVTPVSGPPTLVSAGVDAVKQWTYRPYTLNGEPVRVQTQVMVNFSMGPR